jgi:predicted RecB family nuclease
MQKIREQIFYSASDLANYLECEHLTTLDRLNLDTPMEKTEDGEDAELIQRKGLKHEHAFLETLRSYGLSIADVNQMVGERASTKDKVAATIKAMQSGVDIIYQATFVDGYYLGHADFLRKTSLPSKLGDFSYEVIDTKLSTKKQGKFIIQLMFYTKLLSIVQGVVPNKIYVVLGNKQEVPFYCADYVAYFDALLVRFEAHVANKSANTYPTPCKRCDLCHWRERCKQQRIQDDHLSQVAGILKSQISKLNMAGVQTMADLALLDDINSIPKFNPESLAKIRHQAKLQHHQKTTGEALIDLLPSDPKGRHGFMRLPPPDSGDIYFDMEGNPLEEPRHLEYLFGVYYLEDDAYQFKGFWALNHSEEKKTFEDFMDFVTARLQAYPNAHIYHYAAYEETAIKRLMSFYGTREAEVDNLLREGRLVDLFKVVRESMRTSEPKYSIKNIEHFYLEKREGEVTNAGASIVYFEKWKLTQDKKYLQDIEVYNIDDVRSTQQLHVWLLKQRPASMPWGNAVANKQRETEEKTAKPASNSAALAEQKLEKYRLELLGPIEVAEEDKTHEYYYRELMYHLLGFHRREAKPAWWDYFARREKPFDELLEDAECIAGIQLDPNHPPEDVKQSIRYNCHYPQQEFKLHTGSGAEILEIGRAVSKLDIDSANHHLSFNLGKRHALPDGHFTLAPSSPIDAKALTEAIQRFVENFLSGRSAYKAIADMLQRKLPRLNTGKFSGGIMAESKPLIPQMKDAIQALDESYLIIQGPPGTGKTYSGSKVIVELIKQGYSVAITSNSHKAINNLLLGIEKEAQMQNVSFNGVKKSTGADIELADCANIGIVDDNSEALSGAYQLVAGTAWLLAREEADQMFDYLFVDEAGQLSLGHLVAVATSAKNVVLMGDQMQLGQPTQGVHPGESGLSILEFLLQSHHTVPRDMGIFLGTSYRMHPSVCQFISDAVYDSRLQSAPQTSYQLIETSSSSHPLIRPNGIVYAPIHHQDCVQTSIEEAKLIATLIDELLTTSYIDHSNQHHPITLDDILVITPYNAQVQTILIHCPEGSRVGTVDKFQGQEAPVVLFSMVTSSGDDLPRDIGFLFSKNRLNVAISRAKSLVIFIANPKLMTVPCSNPDEMALVNTLCLLNQYRVDWEG